MAEDVLVFVILVVNDKQILSEWVVKYFLAHKNESKIAFTRLEFTRFIFQM
jgi:hypothetical protein